MKDAGLVLTLAVLLAVSAANAGTSPELACALDRADATGESVPVILTLRSPVEIGSLERGIGLEHLSPGARVPALIACLEDRLRLTLSERMRRLGSMAGVTHLHGDWAGSMIAFRAPPEVIRELAEDSAVELDLDSELGLPSTHPRQAPPSLPSHAEPGLAVINAHRLWELGYTGEGVTVMSPDTGVDLDHPALSRSWRGNHVTRRAAWIDPVYGTETPRDYGIDPPGHGTMTAGVMVGLDPVTQDTIGVAFGAEWIAAGDSTISISIQVACLQWALDPDGDPGTIDDMPAVVNCSWSRGNPGCKETGLTMAISALEAAGVAVVFSAGNSGPAPGSVPWPARMNKTETDAFAVGFVNGHDPGLPIGVISGRGPTECTGLGNAIKPEVVAPGESVRTAWVDSQYATVSGTSLSAPHVSGSIALLKQAFLRKTGTELKMLLLESARDLGEEGEDNAYGAGCIDVYAAYQRGLATDVADLPVQRWALAQNYPNPFNPLTSIRYEVPTRSQVRITVYSLLGSEVARLVDREVPPGSYSSVFDATGLPSGLYVCRMLADGFLQARKLLLLR